MVDSTIGEKLYYQIKVVTCQRYNNVINIFIVPKNLELVVYILKKHNCRHRYMK